MEYVILFVFGIAVGSFINVVILRYLPGERLLKNVKRLGGRSHCPHCRKQLSWYELVPVISFIIQRGKCRKCRKPISWQYPIVELISGLIFVFVPYQLLNYSITQLPITQLLNYQLLATALWLLIFELFLILAVIDFRKYIIPDEITITLGALGLALILIQVIGGIFSSVSSEFFKSYALLFGLRQNILLNYSIAAGIGGGFFSAIILLSRGRAMGWGDAKLAFALGLIFGWPEILMVLSLSFISGALVGIGLIIRGRKTLKDRVPFGPFLVLGGAITFVFSYPIIHFYFSFFNAFLIL